MKDQEFIDVELIIIEELLEKFTEEQIELIQTKFTDRKLAVCQTKTQEILFNYLTSV